MREHQIVITLKPEQFSEVQRLARAANAKSMGIFVRQRLLAALGIDGAAANQKKDINVEVEPILEQMKRLHAELKTFVAESLSVYEQQDGAASAMAVSLEGDELERLAEQAFAISPRLGVIEQGETADLPAPAEFVAASSPSAPADLLERQRQELYQYHDCQRQERHRYHFAIRANIALDQSFTAAVAVRDPLAELLPEAENKLFAKLRRTPVEPSLEDDEDDDLIDVPLSISERQRQLSANGELSAEDDDDDLDESGPGSRAPEGTLFTPANPDNMVTTAQQQSPVAQPAQPVEQVPATSPPVTASDDNLKNGTSSTGFHRLSGSPPPKRRSV